MNGHRKNLIMLPYHPSPRVEFEWFWIQEGIIVVLSEVDIDSPPLWNNKS